MASRYAEVVININGANASGTRSPSAGKGKTTPKVEKDDSSIKLPTASKIASMVLSSANIVNSVVGSYTQNKVRQSNISAGLRIASMGISFSINPILGAIHLATTVGKTIADVSVKQINSQQESAYRRSYMGNITTSGSRWRK